MRTFSKAIAIGLLGLTAAGTIQAQSKGDYMVEMFQRQALAPLLEPYEGDWVLQRTSQYNPLVIMGISTDITKMVRIWSFDYDNLDKRLGQESPQFYPYGNKLVLNLESASKTYTLSDDKKTLTCDNCLRPETWKQSDPNKDLSDRDYARQMAGNPK